MLWAACCLGFFGFLHLGKFTSPSNDYDPSWHLSVKDVTIHSTEKPTMPQVTTKGLKTDQLRQGINIVIGKTGLHICPMKSGFQPWPTVLSHGWRQHLVDKLRAILSQAGVECSRFSGHSFRIGAAMTAAAEGVADSTIQTLGRWKSDSFKRYIRMPHSELVSISAQLIDEEHALFYCITVSLISYLCY